MTHSDPIIEALIKRIEALEARLTAHEASPFYHQHYQPNNYPMWPAYPYMVGGIAGNVDSSNVG